MNYSDASTQVNLEDDMYEKLLRELKIKNKKLEEVNYNTRFNGGKLTDEIKAITVNDELLSLRNEFKKMVIINHKLLKKTTTTTSEEEKEKCFCCVLV